MLQAEERRAGAEDVVSAGEQEGTDGAAGGTDEAAQGDTETVPHSSVFPRCLCSLSVSSPTFSSL